MQFMSVPAVMEAFGVKGVNTRPDYPLTYSMRQCTKKLKNSKTSFLSQLHKCIHSKHMNILLQ